MWILGVILGLVLGSLVECLGRRATTTKSFWGRSFCDNCKKILRWYDLFPILSYILLSGKCRYCHKKIPLEETVVEIVFAVLIGMLFFYTVPANLLELSNAQLILTVAELIFKVFVICVLGILFITDIREGLIPDRISYPAILISLGYLLAASIYKVGLLYQSLSSSVLGKYLLPPHSDYFQRHALLSAATLFSGLESAALITLFFGSLILVTRGRGMGGGDLKLGVFIGLSLGVMNGVLALFLAFVLGSIVGVVLLIFRKKHFGQTIPFGPFLSLGSYTALVFGKQILENYLKF